jgi:hypothetical protein
MIPAALALVAAVAWPAAAQEPFEDRELALLVEEQALLQRQIQRLRGTMELLLQRISVEGRTHATNLIQRALKELDERKAESQSTPLTLDERMDAARLALEQGRLAQSLEEQEQLVARLERLLSILLDRENMEELEARLARLRTYDNALEELATREQKLREETDELRESTASPEARELAQGLERLSRAQQELLRRTEEAGRQSGAAELEALAQELAQLLADQRTDAAVLESYDPRDLARLDAARESLAQALREEARAERLGESAAEIRGAVAAGREAGRDPEQAQARLAAAAEKAQAAARVSGDPSADADARALRAALEELERGERPGADRAAAARALESAAQALEDQAARARERAQTARDATAERLGSTAAPAEQTARELEQAAQALARGDAEEARAATERAGAQLEQARNEEARLSEALQGSQAKAAERARRLERGLSSLPAGETEPGAEARSALGRAAQSMTSAAQETRGGDTGQAAEDAREAVRALEQAQAALEAARAGTGGEQALQALAQEQRELGSQLDALQNLPGETGLEVGARQEVEQALREAHGAMEQGAQELQQGHSASAADSQRRSLDALRKANAGVRAGVRPRPGSDEERARELAQEQERLRREILDLGQRIEEQDPGVDREHLERAEAAMQRAGEALQAGELERAEQAQAEAERELRRQQDSLDQEEERYQRLRAEELLFRLSEELGTMLQTHRAQMQAVAEIQAERTSSDEPSRSVKLRLRGIAREETGLAGRAREMSAAIEQEGSLVHAQALTNMANDLERVAELLSEQGEYQTGERTQALQRDVERSLQWMLDSLQAERKRREQQQGQQGEQQQQQQGEQEPLVPDSAELKLLRRMEVDVQESVDQLLALHPDLGGKVEDIDPEVLRDITRLAARHQSVTRLFRSMRERLGIDAPEPETSPSPDERPADGDSPR